MYTYNIVNILRNNKLINIKTHAKIQRAHQLQKFLVTPGALAANFEVLSSLILMVLLCFPLLKLKRNLLCSTKIEKIQRSRGGKRFFDQNHDRSWRTIEGKEIKKRPLVIITSSFLVLPSASNQKMYRVKKTKLIPTSTMGPSGTRLDSKYTNCSIKFHTRVQLLVTMKPTNCIKWNMMMALLNKCITTKFICMRIQ